MNVMHYELHHFENPDFPIIFHYNHLIRDKYEVLPHWHTNVELLYVISGEAEITSNSDVIPVKRGEIAIINTNHIHSIRSSTEDVRYYCLIMDHHFSRELNFNMITATFHYKTDDPEMKNIFQLIASEAQQMKPYYQTAVKALCNTMIILLFRNQLLKEGSQTDLFSAKLDLVKKGIEFIHNHIDYDLTLDTIVEELGVSKFYFCRMFKEITSTTINDYITELRCHQARTLLTTTTISVEQCAVKCGFRSASYFTKCFKQQFGYLPSKCKGIKVEKTESDMLAIYKKQHEINNSGKSAYSTLCIKS